MRRGAVVKSTQDYAILLRRGSVVVDADPKTMRCEKQPCNMEILATTQDIAAMRSRIGFCSIVLLLKRGGMLMNLKRCICSIVKRDY